MEQQKRITKGRVAGFYKQKIAIGKPFVPPTQRQHEIEASVPRGFKSLLEYSIVKCLRPSKESSVKRVTIPANKSSS